MNDIKIFEKPEFGGVRVLTDNEGNPWFVANDVASALGYANHSKAIKDNVDPVDCTQLKFKASNQQFKALNNNKLAILWTGNDFSVKTLINESGLYSLILRSNLASARDFKNWVTKEVLPSIRKTGEYSVKNGYDNPAWKSTRLDGINFRRTLTDAIRDSGENERMHGHAYSQYTDMAYKMALGMNAKQYRKLKGLTKGDNLRDNLDEAALHKVKIVEDALQFLLTLGYAYQEIKQIYDCKKLN